MTGPEQDVLVAPDDGSLGPLLRVADDRLAPGTSYGVHAHRAVDVVAVVLSGSLRHEWGRGAALGTGDVALLLAWPVLAPRWRRWWLALGVVAVVLVGCTRMWLGVHYLSDVLGGWALGISWCLLVAVALDALPGGRAALPPR